MPLHFILSQAGRADYCALYLPCLHENDWQNRKPKHTYTWRITKDHAPTGDDDDCLTWIYHSHVLPHKDINTGLIGEIKLENVSVFSMSRERVIKR